MKSTLFAGRTLILVVSALILSLLPGCVPSLHGISTKETAFFEPKLVGTWTDKDSTWTFSRRSGTTYQLLFEDDGERKGDFVAVLVKLEDKLFLDISPRDFEGDQAPYWKFHLLPSHTFLLIDELGPKLKFRIMNPSWMKKYLEENPGAIAATMVEDRPILTAETGDLQKFLVKIASMEHAADHDKNAFAKPTELSKKE